jgi:hypothetical protein
VTSRVVGVHAVTVSPLGLPFEGEVGVRVESGARDGDVLGETHEQGVRRDRREAR